MSVVPERNRSPAWIRGPRTASAGAVLDYKYPWGTDRAVVASTCPNCGAPLKPGGRFCAYCGAAVAQPLPSAPAGLPYGSATGPAPFAGTPAPRRSKNRAIAIVVVVVLVIAGGIGAYLYYAQTQNVDVNGFYVYSPDNVCGLALVPTAWTGFNDTPGNTDEILFSPSTGGGVPNYNLTSCTLRGVTTNTSGFGISGPSVPLTIASEGSGTLYFNISLPGSSWSGNVNLIFT